MSSEETLVPPNRERQLSTESKPTKGSSPPPPTKRHKQDTQQRHRTLSLSWDNLSRLFLTRRSLREFNRRTVWPAHPVSTDRSDKDSIHLAQLKRLAKHGGLSLGDLRAYPDPGVNVSYWTEDANQSAPRTQIKSERESKQTSTTKASSAYDRNFERHLLDHGVYHEGHRGLKPRNLNEIEARLALSRASLSPSCFTHADHKDFCIEDLNTLTDASVMGDVFPIITGSAKTPQICHTENLTFGNLKHLTDGSITKAKPGFSDGSLAAKVDNDILKDLGPYIVPLTDTTAPCLPNFFAEGRCRAKTWPVGRRQALYYGALGARGIHELRSFIDPETACDNNAYVIISVVQAGLLDLYTVHARKGQKSPEFHMTQLDAFCVHNNPETFRKAARALRNARDWATEIREELITAANGKALDNKMAADEGVPNTNNSTRSTH